MNLPAWEKTMKNHLRLLDIDDLILMRIILEGGQFVDVANRLALTPPAISHRIKKISEIFEGNLFNVKKNRRRDLSAKGLDIFKKCNEALKVLEAV